MQFADEPVHVAFSCSLMNDVFVVVVANASTELLIVHLWLVLANAPQPSHLVRIDHLELPTVTCPRD